MKDFNFPRRSLEKGDTAKMRTALAEIEDVLQKQDNISAQEQKFIISCKKSTGHRINKITRCNYVMSVINRHLGIE